MTGPDLYRDSSCVWGLRAQMRLDPARPAGPPGPPSARPRALPVPRVSVRPPATVLNSAGVPYGLAGGDRIDPTSTSGSRSGASGTSSGCLYHPGLGVPRRGPGASGRHSSRAPRPGSDRCRGRRGPVVARRLARPATGP